MLLFRLESLLKLRDFKNTPVDVRNMHISFVSSELISFDQMALVKQIDHVLITSLWSVRVTIVAV